MADAADTDEAEIGQQAIRSAVARAIESMTDKLNSGDFKMTVAEFARLLELQKELSAGSIRHVKVTWVEPLDQTEFVS